MEQSDFTQFYAVWVSTCELYGKTPSDGAIDLSFSALSRFDIADVRKALQAHINDPENGRFMPKPADIVRNIEGDGGSRALMAWSKVDKAIRQHGAYASIVFDEPEIMAAIENMGGWLKVCEMTEEEAPFRRNEFCKLYNGFLTRPPQRFPNKLIGLTEAMNSKEHQEYIKPPVMIGNTESAVKVLEYVGELGT